MALIGCTRSVVEFMFRSLSRNSDGRHSAHMANKDNLLSIKLIGWSIIVFNLLILVLHFQPDDIHWQKYRSFIAMGAVFPLDFMVGYLKEDTASHLIWIFMATSCGAGILRLNAVARVSFIVMCIVHFVVLIFLATMKWGDKHFLDYFFRLYFNFVVLLTYVGFLTVPEVLEKFRSDFDRNRWRAFLARLRFKPIGLPDAKSYFNLGLAYARLGQHQDAVAALEKAIMVSPQEAGFHYHLGKIFYESKDFHKAVEQLKNAIGIDLIYWQAYYALGLAYQALGCDQEAQDSFRKVIHLNPEQSDAHKQIGLIYNNLGRYEDALHAFENASRLVKDDEIYFHMGQLYLAKLERWEEAREVLQKAVRVNPANQEAQFQLGMANFKLKRFKDSVRCFKEVLRRNNDHKQAHYHLGFAYAMLKDHDSARREFKYLRQIDPELADTLLLLMK